MTMKILRISSDLKVIFTYLLSVVFVCGLFNNAARASGYVSSNDCMVMSNKLGRTLHETITCKGTTSASAETDGNHKELQTG